jgi:hypothetical protein
VNDIRPIETRYAGCRFRSRLEARWAVFFDTLGIEWEYEPQGFEVGPEERRRRYLPDFYLPGQRVWVEVKGHDAAVDLRLLADAAHPSYGLPLENGADAADWPLMKLRLLLAGPVPESPSFHHAFVVFQGETLAMSPVTPICRNPAEGNPHTHGFTSVVGYSPADVAIEKIQKPLMTWGYGFPCQQIHDGYTAARSARFEFGENG